MRKLILLFQIILMVPVALYAQNKVITGTVKDIGGVLPGASVSEKGIPSNGAVTDINGKFRLTLRGTSNVLIVRFIGYVQQEVNVSGKTNVDVSLQSNNQSLDEVAVVGFTQVKRPTQTGSVSSINAREIRTVPTANVQNALVGRLPGFVSVQSSGQPGRDASDFYIRGQSSLNAGNRPLILVDDIEYTYDQLQQINVNEIEGINILKDAATTAIYGIKGANGVLIVTTRRGKSGSPKFNFRIEGGTQSPTRKPTFLNSYDAVSLISQAEYNDYLDAGSQGEFRPTYSADDLQKFKDGSDPYGHPNTDWYNLIFRKHTYQLNANLDISGGNDRVKYFISGGAFNQNGNAKNFNDPQNLVNTNYYFTRYNFRSNLDLKATKSLNLRLDVTTRFADINSPGQNNPIGTLYDFRTQTPFSAPFLNPNGTYAYNNSPFTPTHYPTINASLANNGYSHDRRTDFNVLLGAVQNLDVWTKGLSVTARVAYASSENFNKNTNTLQGPVKGFPSYYYNSTNGVYTKNPDAPYVNQPYILFGGTSLYTNNLNIQLFSNYDRTFGEHHFTGLLLYNRQSLNDRSNVPANFQGYSAKIGYDYKAKFLIDLNGAYNGTDRFASNNRFGFFPAVGLGYVLSKESFFSEKFPIFSLFKIRGSFGLVGSDSAPDNRYIFIQNYTAYGNGYTFGETANTVGGIYEGTLGNSAVVWEKSRKANIGLDINMLNDKLSITADVFREIRYDQYVRPGAISNVIGVGLPFLNLGKVKNEGFDGQITYRGQAGEFQYNTGLVFSFAKNTILFQSETAPAYPELARTGKPIGQPFGYEYLGYYTDADVQDIKNYIAEHGNNSGNDIGVPTYAYSDGSLIHAGDLKYKDIAGTLDANGKPTGDGIINEFDQKAIGKPNLPNTVLGLTLGASYKGFSINVLFQGSFNYSYIITGNGIEPFQSQFQPIHQQAWTPQTAATAQFPRLTTNFAGTVNSPTTFPSDFWYVNAHYIRLKTIDLGYQLPSNLLPFRINNARVYFSAYNLATWSNFQKYQQDPEVSSNSAGDQYINARVVNLGLQLGF